VKMKFEWFISLFFRKLEKRIPAVKPSASASVMIATWFFLVISFRNFFAWLNVIVGILV